MLKPVNVETPKKNINITSSKTLTKLDKSTPNCDAFTETPALKDNCSSKLNFDISNNIPKSSESSILPGTPESYESIHEVPHVTHQRSVFLCNAYVRNELLDTFYKDCLEFKHYMNDIFKTITIVPKWLLTFQMIMFLYKRKKNCLKKKSKVSKIKIVTLKVTSRRNSKLWETNLGLKIDNVKIPLPIKKR